MASAHSILPGGQVSKVHAVRWLRKYSYYLWSLVELLMGFENPLLLIRIFLKIVPPDTPIIRLRKQGFAFKVRGAMDVWSIKETFLDRFYTRYGFAIQPGWQVMDVGAGVGDYTLFAAHAGHTVQVFAFEPFPGSFDLLQENIRLNKVPNVQVFPHAVDAISGDALLDLSGGEPLQFQSRLEQGTISRKSLQVHVRSLESILLQLGLDAVDLLKLDCEGAEYSILMKSPPAVLARIKHIVMEYHDSVARYNHEDLARFLDEHGYMVEIFPNPVHGNLGYLRAVRNH